MSTPEGPQGASTPATGGTLSSASSALEKVRNRLGGSMVPPAPPPPPGDEDDDEDGMARMSFMEHLEELRSRILRAVAGIVVAAIASLSFSNQLWDFVSKPAVEALKTLNVVPPELVTITPMEGF